MEGHELMVGPTQMKAQKNKKKTQMKALVQVQRSQKVEKKKEVVRLSTKIVFASDLPPYWLLLGTICHKRSIQRLSLIGDCQATICFEVIRLHFY